MKVIFMGTPDFAGNVLAALFEKHEIVLCVTQPDKESGRGKDIHFSAVKQFALEHDIPVFQPKKIREEEAIERLSEIEADIIVVAAFGQILPKEILFMKRFGAVNVHASLLPKYRGASPIQWAILNGDEFTGITTMQMGEGLDDGDILLQEKTRIEANETGGSLFEKLSGLGGRLINETLDGLSKGTIKNRPQEHDKATKVGLITKDMGHIDFTKSAYDIERMIRAFNPWPSAYSRLSNKVVKLWSAKACENLPSDLLKEGEKLSTGEIIRYHDTLYIKTGFGYLMPEVIQLEGKKRMAVSDFLRGHEIKTGDFLA